MWGKLLTAVITVGLLSAGIIIYTEKNVTVETSSGDNMICQESGAECYEKTVAVTFDDGPGKETTPKLLDGLKERNVKAAFFVVGENIQGNEDIIERMHREGHIIGNHTYSHVELTRISQNAALNEIGKTNSLIEDITGEPVKYIRPPCGSWDDSFLYEIDMTPVFWSVDPKDWCTQSVSAVVERVMKNVSDRDIILFHDIYDSSVTAALEVIDRLQAQGYRIVTIDDILIE